MLPSDNLHMHLHWQLQVKRIDFEEKDDRNLFSGLSGEEWCYPGGRTNWLDNKYLKNLRIYTDYTYSGGDIDDVFIGLPPDLPTLRRMVYSGIYFTTTKESTLQLQKL